MSRMAAGTATVAPTAAARLLYYLQLTKPRVMLLVLLTGMTALVVEGSMLSQPLRMALFLLGLFLSGGSANAFNQYFEREIDGEMSRTAWRRPLPAGRIAPARALLFSLTIGSGGVLLLGVAFNWLTAVLSLATILFYSLVYTLLLKPNTYLNTVIGGAAGAMAPVGAWAAATGSTAPEPWAIFLIVFLWTPPHFWSLALIYEADYQRVGLPMLTIVKGVNQTLVQILLYSLATVTASFTPLFLGAGLLYAFTAVVLGGLLIGKALTARKRQTAKQIRNLFRFSIVYLLALLSGLIADRLLALL